MSTTIHYTTKLLVADFALEALKVERDRYEASRLGQKNAVLDDLHVKPEFGTVEIFEGDRNAGCDCEGKKVPVTSPAEANVELERTPSQAPHEDVEVKQVTVSKIGQDLCAVDELSHGSPLNGSTTVGDVPL